MAGRGRGIARAVATAAVVAGLGISPLAGCGNAQQAQPAATTEAAAFDVAGALGSLAFDGHDVSVDATKVLLGVSEDGNVVVTEATTDDDATVVANTCRRAAALSASLEDACVERGDGVVAATRATWVSTTPEGQVTCAVSYEPGNAPEKGTTEELVRGSGGYAMSDAAHDAAGLPSDLPATGGDAVTDESGAAVRPGEATADSGSQPTTESASSGDATQSGSQQQGSGSSSSSPSSGSATKPSSGGQPQASSSSSTSSSSKPSHQHSWQAVYRDEATYEDQPVYENRWVSNWVYATHERWECTACGATFGSWAEISSHIKSTYKDAQHPNGASAIDDSYETKEDQGHYETVLTGTKRVQTGTKQVLDHYECSCGARK